MGSSSDITQRVEGALKTLRPYLEADGGDITLVEVTDELCVRVELHGACADCQMIHMTMKGGVEQAIRQAAPEVVKVEAINWSE
ncbi:MAG: NifU family protein [Crocinitomicaceae bacterium]|jgi:Fe-S cluster biogenesis protein NfuA|nr:nitrogen fixation protein NifU [uncultured bacterium]MBT6162583.1 NifU family protein [Crocinitomicaceae bacterium]